MTGKTPFSAEAWKNVDWLRQATDCFDLTIRSVNVNDRQCLLVFVGGVTGTTSIEPIVESLVFDKGNLAFFPATVTQAGSLEDALDTILQGQTLVILEGSASVAARLQEMNELLEPMHIHLENFGQNSLICRQLPAWMSEIDEQAFLQDVLDLWKDGREVRAEDLQRHRLATIACHHSIRFNRVLSLGEMQEVIEQLARCEQPYHCPHGRPTFITITEKQLIKEFQR